MNLEKGRILPGRLLMREIPESEKTESGLIFKPSLIVKQRTHVGEVVLVGDQLPTLDHNIQVGDRILHSPNAFTNVTIDNVEYRLMDAQQALFIYKGE
jgi:co-chaperonin GroES (HSP10)